MRSWAPTYSSSRPLRTDEGTWSPHGPVQVPDRVPGRKRADARPWPGMLMMRSALSSLLAHGKMKRFGTLVSVQDFLPQTKGKATCLWFGTMSREQEPQGNFQLLRRYALSEPIPGRCCDLFGLQHDEPGDAWFAIRAESKDIGKSNGIDRYCCSHRAANRESGSMN